MLASSNDIEVPASNWTEDPASHRNKGEVIMNRIQKAVAAVMALTITLLGAAGVTAPMAFASVQPTALHQVQTAPGTQPNSRTAMPNPRPV